MNKVVHFEIPVDDLARAKKFYSSVFEWEVNEWPIPGGEVYTGVRTTPVDEKTMMPLEPGSINGAIVNRSANVPTPILTMEVDSVDQYIEKIVAAGGKKVSEKGVVPDMGYFAYVQDSESNVIGLWENMKKA